MSSSEITYLYSLSQKIAIYGNFSLFILGIVGNFINIFLFTFHRQLNKLTISTFLVLSFFGSLSNLIVITLPVFISQVTGNDPLVKYEIVCKLRWLLGPATAITGLHELCLAIINQYLLTSRYIRYHQLITRRRSYFICFIILFYSIALLVPNFVYYKHVINSSNKTTCDISNPIAASYNAYIGIVVYCFIPIFVLSIFALLTYLNVRKLLVRQQQFEKTITRLLISQIIMVLFTTVPFVISRMYFLYTKTIWKSSLQLAQENVASSVTVLLTTSTHWMSFYVYLFASKTFRQNLYDITFKR